jgi:hypothetical protein
MGPGASILEHEHLFDTQFLVCIGSRNSWFGLLVRDPCEQKALIGFPSRVTSSSPAFKLDSSRAPTVLLPSNTTVKYRRGYLWEQNLMCSSLSPRIPPSKIIPGSTSTCVFILVWVSPSDSCFRSLQPTQAQIGATDLKAFYEVRVCMLTYLKFFLGSLFTALHSATKKKKPRAHDWLHTFNRHVNPPFNLHSSSRC